MKDIIKEKMYELTKKPYQKLFKNNKPWSITKQELLIMPQETLRFHLGCFLLKHNFSIQPQLEDHDVFHVLTNTNVSVLNEIAMQYYLFGNGKRSVYLFMVMITGLCLYPFAFKYFFSELKRGQLAHQFYQLNFEKLLHYPITDIQNAFNIK
jgi:hypothetical protein